MNNDNLSSRNFKRLPISKNEGLRDVRDKLTKASGDHAAGKIVGRISEEIGPVELEDRNEDYFKRNLGGLFV